MKKHINLVYFLALSLVLVFAACNKNKSDSSFDAELKSVEADIEFLADGDFEKIIVNPLIKTDDCKYVVSGTIEYYKGGELIAVIDYGDGNCDNIATKATNGETLEFNLDKDDKDGEKSDYKKVIVEPLVKIDGCEYIVSGIIKFYKGDVWVATMDFGDGSCDEWATKYWDGGSKQFSLKKD